MEATMNKILAFAPALAAIALLASFNPAEAHGWNNGGWGGGHGGYGYSHGGGWGGGRGYDHGGGIGWGVAAGIGALVGGAVALAALPFNTVADIAAPGPAVYVQPGYAQPVYAQTVYAQPAYQSYPGYYYPQRVVYSYPQQYNGYYGYARY
jgi:hypothetical protein